MGRRVGGLAAPLLALLVVASGCGQASGGAAGGASAKPTVKIGSANFTEQIIMGELYAQVLEANGYKVERKLNLGTREIVAPALESGQIDITPEYLATYLTYLTKDQSKAGTDPRATAATLQETLKARNLTALDYAPAQDENGFVVTKATADKLKLTKMSDLAQYNDQLILGGPSTCPERPFCLVGLQKTYGLKFKDFKSLDTGGPLTVAALEGGQVDVALLFTTDARIVSKGFVLLQDDKTLQLADNIVPIVRNDLISKAPADLKSSLNAVSAKLTTQEMTQLNKRVDVDKEDAKPVAATWLKSKSLTK